MSTTKKKTRKPTKRATQAAPIPVVETPVVIEEVRESLPEPVIAEASPATIETVPEKTETAEVTPPPPPPAPIIIQYPPLSIYNAPKRISPPVVKTFKTYSTWWDHFKDSKLPKWAKQKWPASFTEHTFKDTSPNIALLTHFLPTYQENYGDLAKIAVPDREEYCNRNGYKHLVASGVYHDQNLYYAIQRLHILYDYLFKAQNDTDFVWVLNIQSIITNFNQRIEEYLDDTHDFYVTKDCHDINMGSFIVRKSEWTKKWLEFLLEESPRINHCWHEQQVVIQYHKDARFSDKIKILPQETINAYDYRQYDWPVTTPGQWQPGSLVLSLPGMNLPQRMVLAKSTFIHNAVKR